MPEGGARPVDEQHAQVDIAALGDGAESALAAARTLAWGEAEIAGEVAAGRKAVDIGRDGHDGGRGQ